MKGARQSIIGYDIECVRAIGVLEQRVANIEGPRQDEGNAAANDISQSNPGDEVPPTEEDDGNESNA